MHQQQLVQETELETNISNTAKSLDGWDSIVSFAVSKVTADWHAAYCNTLSSSQLHILGQLSRASLQGR